MNFILFKEGWIKMKYRSAVFIVTYSKTSKGIEYLILKRKLHWKGWEFPKGAINLFETKKRAVKRELKEETGLVPIKIKKFNIQGKYSYNKKLVDRPKVIGQTYNLFAVEVKKKKVIVDNYEHSGYQWIKFNEAFKKLKWENQRKCLKVVNDLLKHG
jgi:8-oxo-dGTP pyrophosphatase MutT (NUDIX family)